jgi:hypothetical protein
LRKSSRNFRHQTERDERAEEAGHPGQRDCLEHQRSVCANVRIAADDVHDDDRKQRSRDGSDYGSPTDSAFEPNHFNLLFAGKALLRSVAHPNGIWSSFAWSKF